jgi:hypothetical protein
VFSDDDTVMGVFGCGYVRDQYEWLLTTVADLLDELAQPVAFAVQPPLVLTQRRDLVTITGQDLGDRTESQTELAEQ